MDSLVTMRFVWCSCTEDYILDAYMFTLHFPPTVGSSFDHLPKWRRSSSRISPCNFTPTSAKSRAGLKIYVCMCVSVCKEWGWWLGYFQPSAVLSFYPFLPAFECFFFFVPNCHHLNCSKSRFHDHVLL